VGGSLKSLSPYNSAFSGLLFRPPTSGASVGTITEKIEHVVAATRALSSWEVLALKNTRLFCFGNSTSYDNCVNGYCASLDYCSCNTNWYGDTCNLTFCNGIISNDTSVCSSGGRCSSFNTCTCNEYRAGAFCYFDYSRKYNITA
ncbi:hypothetical protein AKO1_002567, partial [Acrasis kona]